MTIWPHAPEEAQRVGGRSAGPGVGTAAEVLGCAGHDLGGPRGTEFGPSGLFVLLSFFLILFSFLNLRLQFKFKFCLSLSFFKKS
jgi:hypothetical protein